MLVNKIGHNFVNIDSRMNIQDRKKAEFIRKEPCFDSVSFKHLPKSRKVSPLSLVWNYYVNKSMVDSKLIFSESISDLRGKMKEVVIKTKDNVKLNCLDINPNNSDKYVLFLHGMSINVSRQQPFYSSMNKKGFGVFALEYRGYGRNPKTKINEDLLNLDVDAAYKYLKDKSSSVDVVAHSAGTSIAARSALEHDDFHSLILIAPIDGVLNTNIKSFAKRGFNVPDFIVKTVEKYPKLVYPFNEAFRCLSELKNIDVPTSIIHSANDRVIPVSVAENLAKNTKNLHDFVIMPDGNHRLDELKKGAALNILSNNK